MKFRQQVSTVGAALTIAIVGLTTAPATAVRVRCQGVDVNVTGTGANESFHIYPNRVEIHSRSLSGDKARIVKRSKGSQLPFTIDTGTGNDVITAHDDVDFIACFQDGKQDGSDRVTKEAGNAAVFFAGDARFDAAGGSNLVRIEGDGLVFGGAGIVSTDLMFSGIGNNNIVILGDGDVVGGDGNDTITIYGNGYVIGGGGDDRIRITLDGSAEGSDGNDTMTIYGDGDATGGRGDDTIDIRGRAFIFGGPGRDHITTGNFDDWIDSGPGADEVHAGGGDDECTLSRKDTYTGCERIVREQASDTTASQ